MDFASNYTYLAADDECMDDIFTTESLKQDKKAKKKKPAPVSTKSKKAAKRASSEEDDADEEEESGSLSDEEYDSKKAGTTENANIRKIKKADTNVCAVNLGTLTDEHAVLFTGDPVLCQGCSAAMTDVSVLVKKTDGGRDVWVCEYCEKPNDVMIDAEEMPKSASIDYLLTPPLEKKGDNDDIIIFCLDISGSMCCTSEVRGDFKIKSNSQLQTNLSQFIEANVGGGRAEQFLPNEDRGVTYVSRLQCVQAAVSSQIENISKTYPKKRIAIVTFSNEVTIYIPGTSATKNHVISGDHLYDYDYCLGAADKFALKVTEPAQKVGDDLNAIVLGLQEGGATALGPALLASVGIAGQTKGSMVVLCTDGVANVGLGSLENYNSSNADTHPATPFYAKLAQNAKDLGVAVSIITIKGTNTSLELIANVSVQTNGYNDVVDPLKLTKNFNFVLQNNILATEVSVEMFLHKALNFKHEQNVSTNKCQRDVGNVNKESTITFEYSIQDKDKLHSLKQLPFQIQIKYTKLNGAKCLRVLSKTTQITEKREEAEKEVNVAVIGLHSHINAAKYAAEGNYTKARMVQKTNMRMVRRALQNPTATEQQQKQYNLWNQEAVKLNSAIKQEYLAEEEMGLDYNSACDDHSDNDDGFGFDLPPPTTTSSASATTTTTGEKKEEKERKDKKEKESEEKLFKEEKAEKKKQKEDRKKARKVRRTEKDELSNVLYQAQNPLFSAFTFNSNTDS